MASVYYLARDVAGDAYIKALGLLLAGSEHFGLVWRDQLSYALTADQMAVDLADLQVRSRRTARWPGSQLLGHKATVHLYKCSLAALPVLVRPGSLFSWLAPAYPEGIHFVRASGRVVLASVSHEREAWALTRSLASQIGPFVTPTKLTLLSENAATVRGAVR